MRKLTAYLWALWLLLFGLQACSREETMSPDAPEHIGRGRVFLQAFPERDSILVGDQLSYGVELYRVPAGTFIGMPYQEAMKPVRDSVLALSSWLRDTLRIYPDGSADIAQSLLLTAFDRGAFPLPPLSVVLLGSDNRPDTLHFEPETLFVAEPPLDPAVFGREFEAGTPDPNGYGIKEPISDPASPEPTGSALLPKILLGISALLILLVLLYLLYVHFYLRPQVRIPQTPREVALASLKRWDDRSYWAPERQKALYSGVTETLKSYIAARFAVNAPEMTSDELLESLRDEPLPAEQMKRLREILMTADYVKFAKFVASDSDNASLVPDSVAFVEATSPEEAEAEKEAQA